MEAFATIDDLLLTWPGKTFTAAEEDAARAKLVGATAQLLSLMAGKGVAVDPGDEVQAENLKGAVCAMVRNSMTAPDAGVQSMTQTIGSTSASISYSNADGAFYVSKHWMRVLGLLGSGAGRMIRAATWADEEGRDG